MKKLRNLNLKKLGEITREFQEKKKKKNFYDVLQNSYNIDDGTTNFVKTLCVKTDNKCFRLTNIDLEARALCIMAVRLAEQ